MIVHELAERLRSYPGAHPNEVWKLEKDLNKCTDKKKQMTRLGSTVEDLILPGLNRGQVAHILFGYRFTKL